MSKETRRKFLKDLALASPFALGGGRLLGNAAFSMYDPSEDHVLIKLREGRKHYTGDHSELTQEGKPSLEEITESNAPQEVQNIKYDYGIQVSSNENPFLANVNVEVLRNKGLPAFIQKFDNGGKAFYRTVVAATKSTEPAIVKSISEAGGFPAKFVYTNLDGFISPEARNIPRGNAFSYSSQLEKELNDRLNNMSRNEFISAMVPVIRTYHENTEGNRRYKEALPAAPEKIAGQIYDAAVRIGIPLASAVSLVATESSFKNVAGDLNLGLDQRAEGYTQIRRPTQELVFDRLKREGFPELPDELPASILENPELQFTLGFKYLQDCEAKHPGNAYACYRLGPNSGRIGIVNQPGYNNSVAFIGKNVMSR